MNATEMNDLINDLPQWIAEAEAQGNAVAVAHLRASLAEVNAQLREDGFAPIAA